MTRALVESHAKSAKPFEPIERERVLERMERASRRRVAVLAAPAGFGKSTALRQHLVRTKTTYVQFTVRKEHATLLDFVRGLAGALAPFVPSAGKSVAGAYQSAARSKNKAGALAHWLALLLRESEGTIVIDDLHAALGDEQVALLVAQLIDLTPEKLRWILSTRDASNLPAATWFARGMADLPVDERDLRLTWEEALAISLRWNSGATEVTVGELFALTGGWPTAFAFALAVSSRTTDLEKVALGTREMIYSYFAEQVFRDLSESDREFLQRTCVLPSIDVALLSAAGYDRASHTLKRLHRSTAFVSQEPDGNYRYHDLFRDFLENELRLRGKSAYVEALREAGSMLERAARPASALGLYQQAGDISGTRRVLADHGKLLLDHGYSEAVTAALAAAARGSAEPAIAALRAEILFRDGDLADSNELFGQALRTATGDLKADIAQRFAGTLVNQFRGLDAMAVIDQVAAGTIADHATRARLLAVKAVGYSTIEKHELAEMAVGEALRLVLETGDGELRAIALRAASYVAGRAGRWEDARTYTLAVVEIARELDLFELLASASSSLVECAYQLGDEEGVHNQTLRLIESAERAGNRWMAAVGLMTLYSRAVERGDDAAAAAYDRQLSALDFMKDGRWSETVLPARALQAAREGNFDEACELLRRAPDPQSSEARVALRNSEVALYWAAAGNRGEAERALKKTGDCIRRVPPRELRATRSTRARLFASLTQILLAQTQEASEGLRELAKERCLVTPGTRALWRVLRALCAGADSDAREHLTRELAGLRSTELGGFAKVIERVALKESFQSAHFAVLTRMELRVLRALSRGATSRAIGAELGRSPQTIDTHIKAILKKLGCKGRHQAVALARDHGVL